MPPLVSGAFSLGTFALKKSFPLSAIFFKQLNMEINLAVFEVCKS